MAISSHKIIVIILVVFWAIYNFTATNEESLYYDNGQIKRSGQLENSLNEGLWNWYYENGQIQLSGNFIQGEREGIWSSYSEDGVLLTTSEYVNNKITGKHIEYDINGSIKEEHIYNEDVLLKRIKY